MPKMLRDSLVKANYQLERGKRFFNLIQGVCGDLFPSWVMVGMIAPPNVPDKDHLRGWGCWRTS